MLIYYITDRSQFAGSEAERQQALLQTIRRASAAGVDLIQLREKDLPCGELERLAREALRIVRGEGQAKLLINHRTDLALAVDADGVHLNSSDLAASEARALAAKAHAGQEFLIGVSCHSVIDVRLAEAHGASFAVLGPIFEKVGVTDNGLGLDELARATRRGEAPDLRVEAGNVRATLPVFALGGVTAGRAALCAAAGAQGVAGIRFLQQAEELEGLVRLLHSL